jgi:hypothetical protein
MTNASFTRPAVAALLLAALGSPAFAQGVLGRVDFQAQPYSIRNWSGALRTLGVADDQRGPKGPGHLWDFSHQTSGGWNNRNYVRFHWWEYDASGVPEETAGFFLPGAFIEPTAQWQNGVEYFFRMRIRFNQPIVPEPSNGETANNKFFIGNIGSGGGDRIMIHLRSGQSQGSCMLNRTLYPAATHVGTRISQNISDDCAGGPLRVGVWEHVQYAFRFGGPGTASVKLWLNNNNYGAPTHQDVNWSTTWNVSRSQMNAGMDLGGYLSDQVENDVTWDLMDVEIANSFDSSWYPGGGSSTTPAAPGNLRVVGDVGLLLLTLIPAGGLAAMRRQKKS